MLESSQRLNLPDFVGIGASRSGTGWLYRAFLHHPHVWVPPIKELHYFDSIELVNHITDRAIHKRRYRLKTLALVRAKHYLAYPVSVFSESLHNKVNVNLGWDLRFFLGSGSVQWYQSLFADAHNDGLLTGEITPRYSLLSSETIQTLKEIYQHVKIILMLRNPVERTWSSISKYFRDSSTKTERKISVGNAKLILKDKLIFEKSSYGEIIDRWQAVFGDDNIGIFYFDDLNDKPEKLLENVANFLGMEPWPETLPESLLRTVNASTYLLGPMPPAVSFLLASHYEPQLEKLRKKLGYPVTKWHDEVREVLVGRN